MADKYDLIVVGAGPGGTAAAKTAAEKKLKVLMLERARTPGDKNMSGSYLFRGISSELFPGFQEAEFNKGQIRIGGISFEWVLDNDEKRYGAVARAGGDAMRDMMTVFRPESDKWIAEQTVKAGTELKTALVTDLIWETTGAETRVKGVVSDAGNFEAPMVIDASGLHSILARRAGLARWDTDKIQLGLKYIYRLDEKVLRERMATYFDSDGVETDWGCMPTMAGSNPECWGAHCVGCPGRGLINVIVYTTLREMVEARVNIHQRMQWLVNNPPYSQLLEGAEFIYCNFHSLATLETVGYVTKSYLPGLILVGDAGGFANPADNFGANVAQWQGRMAAELCAEMKEKKDYSEAMFAKYEENWRNSWVGEDDVHQMNFLVRHGGVQKIMASMDDVISSAFKGKFNNTSYPSIMLGSVPKLLPTLAALVEAPYAMKQVANVGMKKISGLMGVLGMGPGK